MVANPGRRRQFSSALLILPAVLWYVLFFLLPMVFPLVFSFGRSDPTGGVILDTFTIRNYTRFFECNWGAYSELGECIYVKIFVQTILFAVFGTIGTMIVALPLAYFLVTRAGNWRTILFVLIIIPFWTSFLIRTYAWMALLADRGIINGFLFSLGVITQQNPIPLLYNQWAVYLGIIYNYLPLMIFPIYVSLERLDKSLLEASKDLGAGRVATFRQITLPLALPGLLTGILLVFVPLTGEYIIPSLLGGSKTLLMGNLVGNQFLQSRDWSFGAASAMVLIIALIVWIMLWFQLSRGQAVEAI